MMVREPKMKSIESLKNCRNLDEITIEGGSIDNFDLKERDMKKVIIKDCKINSFKLNIEQTVFGKMANLDYLHLINCGLSKIENLSDYDANISSLYIDDNSFKTFDLDRLRALKIFSCKNNGMEELNIENSNLIVLKKIDCSINNLKKLNIPFLNALEEFNCSSNQLSELKFDSEFGYPNLQKLDCSKNQLNQLNTESCKALTELNCSNNQLSALGITYNKNLQYLNCSNNKINTLMVYFNTKLKELDCSNNGMQDLSLIHI